MCYQFMDNNYLELTKKILSNRKFMKLKYEVHHRNTNRYDHSVDVSYRAYKICKKLNLDYKSVARAALLHDFYFDSEFKSECKKILKHPEASLENASKLCNLNDKEISIITSHMFPVGGKIPRNFESLIVNLVDDYVSIRERINGDFRKLRYAVRFIVLLFVCFIKY